MVVVMHKSKFVKSVCQSINQYSFNYCLTECRPNDRRVFLISPEMENKLSTGTDDALGVINIRAIRLI